MKMMKRICSVMLAALIVAGTMIPVPAQAAAISGGVKFGGWASNDQSSAYFYVKSQNVDSFEYKVFSASGKLVKQSSAYVWNFTGDNTKQVCLVQGLKKRSCNYVSLRAHKNGAWTKWSPKYVLVPEIDADWVKLNLNKYTQTASLSWKKVTGAGRYVVYLSKTGKGGWVKAAATTASKVKLKKFKNRKFSSGQTYYVKIVAQKKKGSKWISSAGDTKKFYQYRFWFIY